MTMRMTRIACLAGLALLTTSCVPFGVKLFASDPKLEVDRVQHDFGSIPPTDSVEAIFNITNKGGKPLEITRIQTSCGCTAGMMDSKTVNPGATNRLKVTYDPRGKNGRQEKTLWLFTNDPKNAQKQLNISADVVSATQIQQPSSPPAPVSGPMPEAVTK